MAELGPSNFRGIGKGFLVIGGLIFVLASTAAIAHYFFGMPMYEAWFISPPLFANINP
jgi:hypothetical protein